MDEVVPNLSLDSQAVVGHHWQLSLFGRNWGPVAEGADGSWVLICSSLGPSSHSKKPVMLAGNCGASPRPSARLNCTCFHAGPRGEHSMVDPGGEHKCPVVCVWAVPSYIRKTSLFWHSCYCGCGCRVTKEQCSCLSLLCKCDRLSEGDICLEALECPSLYSRSLSDGLWCCCSLLLQCKYLCLDWECCVMESPCSHLALMAS